MRSIFVLFALFICYMQPLFGQWVQCKGPYGGRINSITSDSTTLFIGTASSGVYKSSDSGTTWTESNTDLPLRNIGLLFNHSHSVYASDISLGTYRLKSNGTWSSTGLMGYSIRSIAFGNGYAFIGGADANANNVVLRSSDDGNSWEKFTIDSLKNAVFACYAQGSTFLIAEAGGTIHKTTNNGIAWQRFQIDTGWVVVHSFLQNGADLYATAERYGQDGAVYKSVNEGRTWMKVNNGLPQKAMSRIAVLQGVLYIVADADGIYKSSDNGASWQRIDTKKSGVSISDLYVYKEYLFISSEYGVVRANPARDEWEVKNQGIRDIEVQTMLSDGADIYAGSLGRGIFRSNDEGESWSFLGLQNKVVYSLLKVGLELWAGVNSGGLQRTSNEGTSWFSKDTIFNNAIVKELRYEGNDIFLRTVNKVTGDALYRTTNRGKSWIEVCSKAKVGGEGYNSFAVIGNQIFVATISSVFVSKDGGEHWAKADAGLQDIAYIEKIFLLDSLLIAESYGVYYSTPVSQIQWKIVSPSYLSPPKLPSVIARRDKEFFVSALYSQVVVLHTKDEKITKVDSLPTIIADKSLRSLTVHANYLFAGMREAGIWKYKLTSPTLIEDVHTMASATPHTISIIPLASYMTLQLCFPAGQDEDEYKGICTFYNELGKNVFNTTLNNNSHQVDIQSLPNGVYYLSFCNERCNYWGKFLVIR